MKKYYFGSGSDHYSLWSCEARNLESAINRFKLEILWPENFVDGKYVEKEISQYDDENTTGRRQYICKPGAKIMVTTENAWFRKRVKEDPEYAEYNKDENWPVLECELLLSECINVNYKDILPQQKLLEGTITTIDSDKTKFPVVGTVRELRGYNKIQIREMTDEINTKKRELELQKDELQRSLQILQSEINHKLRGLYILETFLGVKEEILQIAEGINAPNDMPLTIHQQLLYMDEEYGAWEDQGLDFQSIKEFDKWVVPNIDKFIHSQKGVVAFRVRRYDKTYAYGGTLQDALINSQMNAQNRLTYFLIRNGSNIYRIWSNVTISDRLFPTLNEYQKIMDDVENKGTITWSSDVNEIGKTKAEIEVERQHREYMYGFVAIQGLIERTPIFPGMQSKTNLLAGNTTNIELIRDDEQEFWLMDGRPTWKEFIDTNRETIDVGTRIIFWFGGDRSVYGDDREGRFGGRRPDGYLPVGEVFVVDEKRDKTKDSYYRYHDFKILYQPSDDVYGGKYSYSWQSHKRKNRVGLWLYTDECINYDKITIEECDYYMKNRNYRKDYIKYLGMLAHVKKMKLEDQKVETPLVNLILDKLKLDQTYEIEVRQTINWWKIKNKWKRSVMDNDNVVRMVVKKLRKDLCL